MVLYPLEAVWSLRRLGDGVAVVTTNPFYLPHLVAWTRWLHHKRVVALVYDLYPDALEGAGIAGAGGVLSRLAAASNRALFRRADGVVFIGDKMAAHARARYGEPRRWTVLETGADSREFAGATPGAAARPPVPVLFAYVGNLGLLHDWEGLADGLARLSRSPLAARARFLVAASGPGVAHLREACSGLGDLVQFREPMDDAEWAAEMARVDVALVTLRNEAKRTSIPSKTFSAMAAGSAILAIAPADSDLGEIVASQRCGLRVDPGDGAAVFEAAVTFLREPETLARCRAEALRAVAERYDLAALAVRWGQFLDGLEAKR